MRTPGHYEMISFKCTYIQRRDRVFIKLFSVIIFDRFVCLSDNQLSNMKLQYPDIDVNTKA